MIIAVTNSSLSTITNILDSEKIIYKVYNKKDKDIKDVHIIFPSIKAFYVAFKQNLIQKTPIVIDVIPNIYKIALNYKVYYTDVRIRPNGISHFKKIEKDVFLEYLNLPFKEKLFKSSIKRVIDLLLHEFPSVTHRSFMIAFSQGIKDKFKTFSSYLKENRLGTYDNKKYLLQLNSLLEKALPFLGESDIKDKQIECDVQYLEHCFYLYKDKHLYQCLDDENNIRV